MPWVAAAVIAAGAIANYASNASAQDRAEAIQKGSLGELLRTKIPDPKLQQLALQRFVQEGRLTPEFEQAIKQSPSEFNKVVTDLGQKSAQSRALSQLEDIGYKGGLRLQDKAALQDATMEGQVRDRGARQAILADSAARGQGGGGGFALQAALQGQQASGDRQATSALKVASDAQQRALQSIQGAGDLATKYRSQDFAEQSAKAQANDAINRFNTQNLQDVMHSNTGIANRAQEMNLAARQNVSNQNTELANKEQQYNKELYQQQFDNQMKLANARNGIYSGMSNLELQRGQNQGNAFSNASQGVAGGVAAQNSNNKNDAFWDDYFKRQNQGSSGGNYSGSGGTTIA